MTKTLPLTCLNILNTRERMWRQSTPEPNTGCWLYMGDAVTGGYGRIKFAGKNHLTHRLSFAMTVGVMPPPTVVVMHLCNQPSCWNPSHLAPGTQKENVSHSWAAGRGRIPFRIGERCNSAKLTDEIVREIRSRYSAGETQSQIAARFSCAQMTVSCIVRRKTWSHIQ